MRIWRKVLCLMMSALMLFTLVACDPKEDTPGSTTDGSGGVVGDNTTSTTTSADGGNQEGTTTTGTGTTNHSVENIDTIIPSGYGTDAWKPFGTATFYDEEPWTTNAKVFPNSYVETKNGRTRMYSDGKETAPIM